MSFPPWFWPPDPGSAPPPALAVDAGANASVELGVSHAIVGSASGGVPGYTYLWSVQSAPVGGVATFDDATDPTTNVTFSVSEGAYVVKLTVHDSVGTVAADVARFAVAPLLDVNAGTPQSVALNVPLALSPTVVGGFPPYTYNWQLISAPPGGVATFDDDSDPTTNVTFTVVAGSYTLQLNVLDSLGNSAADPVTETATLPLSVDAGPDSVASFGFPLTLEGSAANGTPPYTYLWTVDSAPPGGVAVFVDDTDPTTDVSFSVAAGAYVLRLTVTDAASVVVSDTVTETASSLFLLDVLTQQPVWADWVGGRLSSAYAGPVLRARNSLGATLDVGTLPNGLTDVAALVAFANLGDGNATLHRRFNQVVNAFAFVDPSAGVASEAVLVESGVPVLGDNGLLAGRWDGVGTCYSRNDALGLSNVNDVTFGTDCNSDGDSYGYFVSLNGAGVTPSFWFSLALDVYDNGSYLGNLDECSAFSDYAFASVESPMPGRRGWIQGALPAGQPTGSAVLRTNGVVAAITQSVNAAPVNPGPHFVLGTYPTGAFPAPPQAYPAFGGSAGRLSNTLVWSLLLDGTNQPLFDFWEQVHGA